MKNATITISLTLASVALLAGCASTDVAETPVDNSAETAAVCNGFANQHNQLAAITFKGIGSASDNDVAEAVFTTMHEYVAELSAFQNADPDVLKNLEAVSALIPGDVTDILLDPELSAEYSDASQALASACVAADNLIYLVSMPSLGIG